MEAILGIWKKIYVLFRSKQIYIYIQCTGLTLFFIFDIFSLSKREKKEAKKKESELKTEKYVSEQSVRISSDKRK